MGFPDSWTDICLYGYIPHIPGVAITTCVNSDIQFRGQLGSGTLEANVNIRSSVGFSLCCRPIEINECCHSAASGCPYFQYRFTCCFSPIYHHRTQKSSSILWPEFQVSSSCGFNLLTKISGSGNKFYILHSMAENVQEILCYKG